jgi:hypothetical protein
MSIAPDSKAVVESEQSKNNAALAGAVGLCAQVVVPERQLKDEQKVREAVSSARKSFSVSSARGSIFQSGSGPGDSEASGTLINGRAVDAAVLGEPSNDTGDIPDVSTATSSSERAHMNIKGARYKGKRPSSMIIPAKESANPGDQVQAVGNLCVDQKSPLVSRGKRDLDTMLPSSLSPKWLQNLLQHAKPPKGKRSGSSHRRASETAAASTTPRRTSSTTPRRTSM